MSLKHRPRRLRRSATIRDLVQETQLTADDFVYPVFVHEGNASEDIKAMPGQKRHSLKDLAATIKEASELGVKSFAIFPAIPESKKDSMATESTNPNGLVPKTIEAIKSIDNELCVITDVAMDPFSSDGHDGIVKEGQIINDETLEVLAAMALTQADAGADFVAPSDMMDGRVKYIRKKLDKADCSHVGIISYTAKYASAYYGPFREALDSAPKFGDKKTYQMNPANRREAIFEAKLDFHEGADVMMVKPALAYLDIISELKRRFPIPLACYNVSGEYSMIKAAAKAGLIDEDKVILETLMGMKRAGADMIFTYHAVEAAKLLRATT